MEYEKITTADQANLLDDRLRQFEMEHYAHTMNEANLKALPKSKEGDKAIAQIAVDLSALEKAIDVHRTKRASIPDA